MPSRPRFNPEPAPAAVPAAAATPPAKAAPAKPSSRDGKKAVLFYVPHDAWLQLRLLTGKRRQSLQDFYVDLTDRAFAEEGMQRIARAPATGEEAA